MMIRPYTACLVKELKGQQNHFFWMAGMIPAVALLMGLFSEFFDPSTPITINLLGRTCFIVGIFVFGTDLIQGERRRGTDDFIDRLPVSRSRIFFSKTFACFLLVLGFTLVGIALAFLFYYFFGGTWDAWIEYWRSIRGPLLSAELEFRLGYHFFSTLLIMLWIACWFKRSGVILILLAILLILNLNLYWIICLSPLAVAIKVPILAAVPVVILGLAWGSFVLGGRWRATR